MTLELSDSTIDVQHYDERDGETPGEHYTALVQSWRVPMEAEPGTIIVPPDDLPALAEAVLAAIEWWGLRPIQADKIEHEGRTYFLALCRVEWEGDRFVIRHDGGQFSVAGALLAPETQALLKGHCKR